MSQWIADQKIDFVKIKHWTGTVAITVGNYGYRELISNLLWNLETNTDLFPHTVVFSYDRKLIDYVHRVHPTAHTYYLTFDKVADFNFRKAVAFKEQHWDELTLYKLHAIWWLLNNTELNVFYTDADIYYLRTPLTHAVHEIKGYKMLIQEGVVYKDTRTGADKLGYCSGMLYVPKNSLTLDVFSPENWSLCQMDDENYLKTFIKSQAYETEVGLFNSDQFPVGTIWRKGEPWIRQQLKLKHFVCIHFNYIKGIDQKIERMKYYGMWLKAMDIVSVPKKFQPDLNEIVKKRRKGHTFPPHQKDKQQIEEFAHHYITEYTKTTRILSSYHYLPVYWTAIGVLGDATLKRELNEWLAKLMKNNPHQMYWTIVQHCKGVRGACDVEFSPDRIRIFGTTRQPGKITNVPSTKHGSSGITSVSVKMKPVSKERLHLVLPLICAPHPQPKTAPKHRTVLASFIGSIENHPLRRRMERLLRGKNGIVIEAGDYKFTENMHRFRDLMTDSVFALCPRGVGSTSFRFAEALQFGAIPVYISDIFSLPFPNEINWKNCCVTVTPDQLPQLYTRLQKITPAQIKAMQDYGKTVYQEYMTIEKACEHLIKYI